MMHLTEHANESRWSPSRAHHTGDTGFYDLVKQGQVTLPAAKGRRG
jgi:hypothetical protein